MESPDKSVVERTVVIFHDESTLQVNDDQPTLWAIPGTAVMQPKSKDSRLKVSNFIEEKGGYLHMTVEEFNHAKRKDPTILKHAHQLLDYGEAREGYWSSEKFMKQVKRAEKLLWLSIQERRNGDWCGYLTTATATLPCQMMLWIM